MSRRSTCDEVIVREAEKWIKPQKPTPEWGSEAKNGDHLWSRTSVSGDLCYVTDSTCAKHGPRVKCASCKIIVHAECVTLLIEKMKILCRPTFQDAGVGLHREKTEVSHHWIARHTHKGRCKRCSKSFHSKLPFGGKVGNLLNDIIVRSCTWCKLAYHNKDSCFNEPTFSEDNCCLGVHAGLIVPPTWIVKLPFNESEISQQVFAIKPIPSSTSKPLLIFINPKSGGNQGAKLLKTFQWLVNPRQVFDLTEGGPRTGLELFRKVPNLRILACGGDGTVGWILSILDELKVTPSPPIAILPLGTGNDLARALGWGGGYTDEPLSKILMNVEDGETVKLDRWLLKVTPNSNVDLSNCEEGKSSLSLNVVNNYFSLGVDALIALEFHEAREARPDKFNSRFWNKMFYGQAGGKDLIQRKWKDLCNFVTLECDGQDFTYKLKDLKVHSILFLNIPCYGGGTMPWGCPGGKHFHPPSTQDGMIEVIGLTTYQLPLLQAGGHGTPIAQCRHARLVTSCAIPVQVDGEPCRLLPSIVDIEHWNSVNMVAKTKKHGNTRKEENVEKMSLQVKQLKMEDYEAHHHHKESLKDKDASLGSLSISFNTDLADIRVKINQLIEDDAKKINEVKDSHDDEKEKEDGVNVQQEALDWWFLDACTADKFYRIDQAQEPFYYVADVCEQDLYILREELPLENEQSDVIAEKVLPSVDDVSKESTSSGSPQSGDSRDYRVPILNGDNIGTRVSSVDSPRYKRCSHRSVLRDLVERNEPIENDVINAAMMGNLNDVARLHTEGHCLTDTDRDGRTALHHAAFIGNTDVVRYLVYYGPPSLLDMADYIMYHTALHRAATRGDRVICSLLVCAGASLDPIDKQGSTAQQLAAMVGDKTLAEYLETMKKAITV